jgi:hypothetical protein
MMAWWPPQNAFGHRREGASRLVALALIVSYLFFSWQPFRLDPPKYVVNSLVQDGDVWRFDGPSIAVTDGAPSWLPRAIGADVVVIELRFRSARAIQEGPARILAVSSPEGGRADLFHHNLLIGQEGSDLVVRVRRPDSVDSLGRPALVASGAVRSGRWQEVRLKIDHAITLSVDGLTRDSVENAAGWGATWEPEFVLSLGNTPSGGRPWLGEIEQASVRANGHVADLLRAETFRVPERFWVVPSRLQEGGGRPALGVALAGALHVSVGAILFAAVWLLLPISPTRRALFCVTALIFVANAGKVLVATRHPSVGAALVQWGGAGLGFLLIGVVTDQAGVDLPPPRAL